MTFENFNVENLYDFEAFEIMVNFELNKLIVEN